jgi:hypothetical protein
LPIFIEFELFYNDIFGIKKLADFLNAQAHLGGYGVRHHKKTKGQFYPCGKYIELNKESPKNIYF